jgi:hypothetical protein
VGEIDDAAAAIAVTIHNDEENARGPELRQLNK